MSEWWTYTLSDFLLFSPRTYYRLLELYNVAIWPAQIAGGAIGLGVVALLAAKRGRRDRLIAGLLAACWLWIAWAFHYQRYAQINWAAHVVRRCIRVPGVAPRRARRSRRPHRLAIPKRPRTAGSQSRSSQSSSSRIRCWRRSQGVHGRPWRPSAWRPTQRRSRASRRWRWSAGASDGCCWSFHCSGARSPQRRCGRWLHRRPLSWRGPPCLRCGPRYAESVTAELARCADSRPTRDIPVRRLARRTPSWRVDVDEADLDSAAYDLSPRPGAFLVSVASDASPAGSSARHGPRIAAMTIAFCTSRRDPINVCLENRRCGCDGPRGAIRASVRRTGAAGAVGAGNEAWVSGVRPQKSGGTSFSCAASGGDATGGASAWRRRAALWIR